MHIDAALSLSQPRSQDLVPVSRHDAFDIVECPLKVPVLFWGMMCFRPISVLH